MTYLDKEFESIEELIATGSHATNYITNEILFLIAKVLRGKV